MLVVTERKIGASFKGGILVVLRYVELANIYYHQIDKGWPSILGEVTKYRLRPPLYATPANLDRQV